MAKILFVHAPGGVPLDHAIPRMAKQGDLHVISTVMLDSSQPWMRDCVSVEALPPGTEGELLIDEIVNRGRALKVDAVIAWSEYLLMTVAEAARRLSLRGPGHNAVLSRDKASMREAWSAAGVPVPRFLPVTSRAELDEASRALRPPVLLKPAWGAGSVGQALVSERSDLLPAWEKLSETLGSLAEKGFGERLIDNARGQFVAEEVIQGDGAAWFGPDSGIADYVSVEGFVAEGIYHPVAITGRLPWIGDFTEMGSFAPADLDSARTRMIVDAARRAVDALGLFNCGTHTELKLTADGPVLIESAARLGGSAITEVVERSHRIDLVSTVTRVLLGSNDPVVKIPGHGGQGAVAELSLIGADSDGNPWQRSQVWNPAALNDPALGLSAGTTLRAVEAMTVSTGTDIRPFVPELGITNCAGMLVLTARDSRTLVQDARNVFNNLEKALSRAQSAAVPERRTIDA